MWYFDSRGTPIRLTNKIGQGGEAAIYRIAEHHDLLAKIYLDERPEYEQKIEWMREYPPSDPTAHMHHASIAWPLDLLYDRNRIFAGYLMPFIQDAVPLLGVFNPRLRKIKLPSFTERYLFNTARNLAISLGAIHDRGYVVGDLNESNVMVTPSTLITMIDTDSFQVEAESYSGESILFLCPVGKPEYTPPEMQNRSFLDTERAPQHDLFALGILVFQLLMDGSHPFRGRWSGAKKQPPIEERIEAGWFPYKKNRGIPLSPPTNALPLTALNPEITDLFFRCFVDGHRNPHKRPTPTMWEEALRFAESSLIECSFGHFYSNHLQDCPHCEREDYIDNILNNPKVVPTPPPRPQKRTVSPRPVKTTQPTPAAQPSAQPIYYRPTLQIRNPIAPVVNAIFNFSQVAAGMAGQLTFIAVFASIFGSVMGQQFGASLAGGVSGGAGGMLSGLLVTDIIQRKDGWEILWGVFGVITGVWAVVGSGVAMTLGWWVLTIALSGLSGALFGAFIKQFDLSILGAFAGVLGGAALGSAISGWFGAVMADGAWIGGAVSGGLSGLVTGGIYFFRDRI